MINKFTLATDTFSKQEFDVINKVMRSRNYTMGGIVKKFEKALAKWIGVNNSIMVNSGSSANLLIIESLLRRSIEFNNLKQGDEIIVPALSWPTTVWPIIQLGLKPVFVDSNPETLAICLKSAERLVSKKTKAIFLIHVLGYAEKIKDYKIFCKKNNLILIEDCCESLGAFSDKKHVGTQGYAGSLSHFFSHHLTTIEGGSIITNDNYLADDIRSIRAHGWVRDRKDKSFLIKKYKNFDSRFLFFTSGYNVRPMELQAAIGIIQLKRLDLFLKKRDKIAFNVNKILSEVPWLKVVGKEKIKNGEIKKKDREHSWMNIPIILETDSPIKLKKVKNIFEKFNVQTRPIIAGNILKHPALKKINYRFDKNLSIANNCLENGFMIGCHPNIGIRQLDLLSNVTKILKKF
jgi:CDP-6-deoxy-D-xylo-4-hexulose-3-dehydrase